MDFGIEWTANQADEIKAIIKAFERVGLDALEQFSDAIPRRFRLHLMPKQIADILITHSATAEV